MHLEGQHGERGYAMAVLLVGLAVMSVLMTAALPTWNHAAQREKEAELVFRGEQYARAVALFRAKNGNAFPPSIDVLVQGKYLRKKYLDPVTKGEFEVIGAASLAQTQAAPGGRAGVVGPGGSAAGTGLPGTAPEAVRGIVPGAAGQQVSAVGGGIVGVRSKSDETSIRVYKGQTKYNLWSFIFTSVNRPGSALPGAVNPGGRGVDPAGGRGPGGGFGAPGRGVGAGGANPGGAGPGGPGGRGPQRGFEIQPFGSGAGRGRAGS